MKLLKKRGVSLKSKWNGASSILWATVPSTPWLLWLLSGALVSSSWKSLPTRADSLLLLLHLPPQPGWRRICLRLPSQLLFCSCLSVSRDLVAPSPGLHLQGEPPTWLRTSRHSFWASEVAPLGVGVAGVEFPEAQFLPQHPPIRCCKSELVPHPLPAVFIFNISNILPGSKDSSLPSRAQIKVMPPRALMVLAESTWGARCIPCVILRVTKQRRCPSSQAGAECPRLPWDLEGGGERGGALSCQSPAVAPLTSQPWGAVGQKVKVRNSQQIFGGLFPRPVGLDTR